MSVLSTTDIIGRHGGALPEHLRGALDRYVEHRIPPGGFLTAVLSNDLREAMCRADETSRASLYDIVRYCYNEIPADCWGSREAVHAWLQGDEGEPETERRRRLA